MKLITFVLLMSLFFSCGNDEQARLSAPEIPVFVTEERDIPVYEEFVGQIYGYKDIAIRARVEGYLEGIYFKEGARVEKNKLLYSIESQPFEANVAAMLSKVAEAKTMQVKAESDLNRIRPLAEQKAVSESDLDAAVALYDAAVASVEAANANLRAARIQLSYTKIYSPILGLIGQTQAKVGDFVGREPNPVILNVVSRIDTVLVEFFITESQYLDLARTVLSEYKRGERLRRTQKDAFELFLSDGSLYEHKGRLNFIDRNVDANTGAMLIQTSFQNPDQYLRPGQFAKVKAQTSIVKNGVLIPQRCVTELQGLYRVFVVNDSNQVQLREINAGAKIADFWIVTKGLKAGEKVVYEGIQKLRENMIVNPQIKEIQPIKQEN